jgi:hypothetical protein
VLTSTSHTGPPFLEFDWLIPGTLVVMIDRLRVITRGLLARAGRIVTNSRESLASWGVEGRARVHATMPEIIAEQNRKPVGPHEIVLYDAGGLAVADLAFAALLWRRLQSSRQASLAARRTLVGSSPSARPNTLESHTLAMLGLVRNSTQPTGSPPLAVISADSSDQPVI